MPASPEVPLRRNRNFLLLISGQVVSSAGDQVQNFALLLLLVRLQWAPLESADHGAAARLNSLVAGHAVAIGIVKAVTWLGSGGVLWALIGMAVVVLAIRRRWRLAAYLLVNTFCYNVICINYDVCG